MAHLVILGAGLTGLSTAYHLEQYGYYDYKIFEKENSVGGLCRSITQDGFTFDYTGHLLHTSDTYFRALLDHLIGFKNLNAITRRSYIYSHNTYTKYPFQVNLHGLPPEIIVECIEKYVTRPRARAGHTPKNFYRWVLHNFGAGIGNHFFFPFQRKLFDYDIKKLSSSWTGRFVPQTSLESLIKGALSLTSNSEPIGYNAQFYYPRQGGIFSWVNNLHKKLIDPVKTGFQVKTVDLIHNQVIFTNGACEPFTYLINTIPLDIFLKTLKESSDQQLSHAHHSLRCNKVININWGINRPDLSDHHWIYYPEKQYPFYRVGFPHNFSEKSVLPGCSSLYAEFSVLNKSRVYTDQLLTKSREALKQAFTITDQEIITEKIITIDHAYVIFNTWRDKYLPALLHTLEQEKIFSIGRYGAWKYASMQEAILDGKNTAQKVLELIDPHFLSNQNRILHYDHPSAL